MFIPKSIVCILLHWCVYLHLAGGQGVSVTTDIGTIIGEVSRSSFDGTQISVTQFLGIPFAEPPVGDRRFERPVKKAPFPEPFSAKTMAPHCSQERAGLEYIMNASNVVISEDCLYLNILVPGDTISTSQPKAVMIYIYGGGFQTGGQDVYTSPTFAGLNDVILVTLNYRVTVFGFLSSGNSYMPGNYGLWDQHMAIQWVHNHIDKFGGDQGRVTIFGESAGAASVIYQALYEGNQGLVQRVIAQSGTVNLPWAFENNPGKLLNKIISASNCMVGTVPTIIRCLKNKTADELLSAVDAYSIKPDYFFPVVDGEFVKENPNDIMVNKTDLSWLIQKQFGNIDLIIGVNSAEEGMTLPFIEALFLGGGNHSHGYSVYELDNNIIPALYEYFLYKELPNVTHEAILHEYVDWKRPSDTYMIRDNTLALFSDVKFYAGSISTANVHAGSGATGRTFLYVYDYRLSLLQSPWYSGASHAEEIPVLFGLMEEMLRGSLVNFTGDDPKSHLTPTDYLVSRQMMEYWTNFAKTG